MPGWLCYADNHLWLDTGDDGLCHLGVDAFLARLVGEVERLTFLTVKGDVRPAVVLTVGGVDLTLVFPQHLPLVAANTRLRSGLDRLVGDPYGLGWLFTARSRRSSARACATGRLPAAGWPPRSPACRRRSTSTCCARGPERLCPPTAGSPAPGFLRHLEHEDVLRLFAAFFPLPVETRRAP